MDGRRLQSTIRLFDDRRADEVQMSRLPVDGRGRRVRFRRS